MAGENGWCGDGKLYYTYTQVLPITVSKYYNTKFKIKN